MTVITHTARRSGGPASPGLSGRPATMAAGQSGPPSASEAVLMACVLARHGNAPLLGVNADLDYVTTILTTHLNGSHEEILRWRDFVPGGEFAWRHRWTTARSAVRCLYPQLPSAAAAIFPQYDDAAAALFPPVVQPSTLPG